MKVVMETALSGHTTNRPNSLACLSCRRRHLKCDATRPTCQRCDQLRIECQYVRSRRGFRSHRGDSPSAPITHHSSQILDRELPPPSETGVVANPTDLSESVATTDVDVHDPILHTTAAFIPLQGELQFQRQSPFDPCPHLVNAYFKYVHPAHPFVLPKKLYMQYAGNKSVRLHQIVCFMGGQSIAEQTHQPDLEVWFGIEGEFTAFDVQAFLLFALTSFARFERQDGARALLEAQTIAARINMSSNDFDRCSSAVMRESWRRTSWELYTVSSLISLVAGVDLRLRPNEDLELPGHCEMYNAGSASSAPATNMVSMRNRFSSESAYDWSSFAYKVEATRVLNGVLQYLFMNEEGSSLESQIRASEALISSYLLALPDSKRSPMLHDGTVDEVMSCALMIIHLASICIHFPHSGLVDGKFKMVCGNQILLRESILDANHSVHRIAVIRSANDLTKLLTMRTDLASLTPCFSCAISFAAAVHLSASVQVQGQRAEFVEQLNLDLAALQVLSQKWPIAGVVRAQLAQFVRMVLRDSTGTGASMDAGLVEIPGSMFEPFDWDELSLSNMSSERVGFPTDGFSIDIGQ